MGFRCSVPGCQSKSSKSNRDKIRFFPLPAVITKQCDKTKDLSTRRRQLWVLRLNLPDNKVNNYTRVCEKHFVNGTPSELFEESSVDWAPSIDVFIENSVLMNQVGSDDSSSDDQSCSSESSSSIDWEREVGLHKEHHQEDCTGYANAANQADFTNDLIGKKLYDQVVSDNAAMRKENQLLRAKICEFSEEQLASSDYTVKFYTGLPTFKSLKVVYKVVCVKVDYTTHNALSKFQEFMVVMMRLRLKLIEQDLAFRFDVSQACVCDICERWLQVMSTRLQKLIETSSPLDWENMVRIHEECPQDNSDRFADAGSQTGLTNDDFIDKAQYYQSVSVNLALRNENHFLKAKICEFSEEQLALSDFKVNFYTGLPTFKSLKLLFEVVSVEVDYTVHNALSKFQEFVVVLMRLRLNLLEQDLAFRFGVCQGSICNICERWLHIMSVRLQRLIVWPNREVLDRTVPECFRSAFGDKLAVILDCFEIFVDRPSYLLPKSETWSQYTHQNCVKFLIGISPKGTVSFISKAWGGTASDKWITEKSGILDKLMEGDVVLLDHSFIIDESVGMYRAKLNIPVYTKGRFQLPDEKARATQEIDNLRVHVSKVIGLVKHNFKILQGSLPVDYLTLRAGDTEAPIVHVVRICCALTNLCLSVIPLSFSVDSSKDLNT